MKKLLVLAAVCGCHGGGPATTAGSASGSGASCAAKLADLAKFYDVTAAENASAAENPGLHAAEMEAGFDKLPTVTGTAADLSKADVLVIGTIGIEYVSASGERGNLATDEMWGVTAPDAKTELVLYIDERVPWQRVQAVLKHLSSSEYASYGVAYRSEGSRAGRTPPKVPGADEHGVDIPAVGDAIAKTAAAHCPEYAKQLAALQNGGRMEAPELLRSLGKTIPHCDCGVDTTLLEAFPWLVARPVVTVVPVSSSAPPLHGADSATWGDLVRDAKGPVSMPPPPPLPPPPPPPPPHRR